MERSYFKSQDLSRVSFLLAILTLTFFVFRFLIVILIAKKFGAGEIADVLFIAQLIPVTLFMQNRRALFYGFVPVYIEYSVNADERKLWDFTSQFTNLTVLATFIFTLLYFLGAPYLMRILTIGFTPEQRVVTVHFTQLLSPVMLFFMVFAVLESVFYCHRHFTTPNWANLLGGLGGILGVIFLTDRYGIFGYGYGSLVGYFLQVAIPLSLFRKYRRNYSFSLDLRNPGLVKTYKLLVPIYVVSAIIGLVHITDRTLATTLGPGRVSAFQYCSSVIWFLPLVLTNSILAPLFPMLSEKVVKNEIESLKDIVRKGTQVLFFAITPIVTAAVLLHNPIIQLLFQRGAFTSKDTALTANAFIFYSPFILFMALSLFYTQVVINLNLVSVLAKWGVLILAMNFLLCLGLMKLFDVGGIALSMTMIILLQTWVMTLLIRGRVGPIGLGRLVKPTVKVLSACALSAVPAYYMYVYLEPRFNVSNLSLRFLGLVVESGIFFAIYAVFVWIFRMEEAGLFYRLLKNKKREQKSELSMPIIAGG